jgi:hypothetical protein
MIMNGKYCSFGSKTYVFSHFNFLTAIIPCIVPQNYMFRPYKAIIRFVIHKSLHLVVNTLFCQLLKLSKIFKNLTQFVNFQFLCRNFFLGAIVEQLSFYFI